MARPFSYPEVQQLEVGDSVEVQGTFGEVSSKVRKYAIRQRASGRSVHFTTSHRGGDSFVTVTRVADPEPRAE